MFEIYNVAMTGALIAFTFPLDTASAAFQAVGGAISMFAANSDAGPFWTIQQDKPEAVDARTLSGETVYFKAATGTLQIRLLKGLLS